MTAWMTEQLPAGSADDSTSGREKGVQLRLVHGAFTSSTAKSPTPAADEERVASNGDDCEESSSENLHDDACILDGMYQVSQL